MQLRLIFLTALIALIAGCSSERSVSSEQQVPESLKGTWQWVQTCSGWGVCRGPAEVGYEMSAVFADGLRFHEYTNGSLTFSSTFQLNTRGTSDGGTELLLQIDGRGREMIVRKPTGDSLVLVETCIDCGSQTYVR